MNDKGHLRGKGERAFKREEGGPELLSYFRVFLFFTLDNGTREMGDGGMVGKMY